MTTTVIVQPNGHNIEVVLRDRVGVTHTVETLRPDPHDEHRFTVYDDRTVTVRELEGWAPKPEIVAEG
jgi:hypothetical protein